MINPYHGVSRTVKATYYKSSLANFLHTESRGAGGYYRSNAMRRLSINPASGGGVSRTIPAMYGDIAKSNICRTDGFTLAAIINIEKV